MSDATSAKPRLAHQVYFTLKDSSDATRRQLVASCRNHLTDHPGTVYFCVGMLTPDLAREVNDHDFDVALNIVFATRADHDRYQTSERHLAFIAENQATWARVRVFDSDAG